MPRGKARYYQKEAEYDPDPLYAVEVDEDGRLHHEVAFDPKYYQQCEKCTTVFPIGEEHDCP